MQLPFSKRYPGWQLPPSAQVSAWAAGWGRVGRTSATSRAAAQVLLKMPMASSSQLTPIYNLQSYCSAYVCILAFHSQHLREVLLWQQFFSHLPAVFTSSVDSCT